MNDLMLVINDFAALSLAKKIQNPKNKPGAAIPVTYKEMDAYASGKILFPDKCKVPDIDGVSFIPMERDKDYVLIFKKGKLSKDTLDSIMHSPSRKSGRLKLLQVEY